MLWSAHLSYLLVSDRTLHIDSSTDRKMQQLILVNYLIWSLCWIGCWTSLSFMNPSYDGIQVGVPFTLMWENATGAVTLGLLFRTNSSSPQNTSIIACTYPSDGKVGCGLLILIPAGIIGSQYTWTPPDWTSGVFAQKIEAQDAAKNLALTGSFTIENPLSAATSIQQVIHL
jgi:hypothetical protein